MKVNLIVELFGAWPNDDFVGSWLIERGFLRPPYADGLDRFV
jgi:hypothetical protein